MHGLMGGPKPIPNHTLITVSLASDLAVGDVSAARGPVLELPSDGDGT